MRAPTSGRRAAIAATCLVILAGRAARRARRALARGKDGTRAQGRRLLTKTPATDPDGDTVAYRSSATVGTVTPTGLVTIEGFELQSASYSVGMDQSGRFPGGTVTIATSDGRGGTDTFDFVFR